MGAQSLARRDTGKARRVGSHRGSPHSILVHVKVFGGHSLAPGVRYWGARPQVNQSRRRPGIVRRRSSWQARTLELRAASPRRPTLTLLSLSLFHLLSHLHSPPHTSTPPLASSSSSPSSHNHSILCKSVHLRLLHAEALPLAARILAG